jgi:hypothetical protein
VVLTLLGLIIAGVFLFVVIEAPFDRDIPTLTVGVIFMLSFSALLLWFGSTWLFPKEPQAEEPHVDRSGRYLPILAKMRPLLELGAMASMVVAGLRAIWLVFGADWMAPGVWRALMAVAVLIGWLSGLMQPREESGTGLHRSEAARQWSPPTRRLVGALVQVGGLGFFVIPVVWLHWLAPWNEQTIVQLVASVLVGCLFAAQAVTLRFGEIRAGAHLPEEPQSGDASPT